MADKEKKQKELEDKFRNQLITQYSDLLKAIYSYRFFKAMKICDEMKIAAGLIAADDTDDFKLTCLPPGAALTKPC